MITLAASGLRFFLGNQTVLTGVLTDVSVELCLIIKVPAGVLTGVPAGVLTGVPSSISTVPLTPL